jgi:hypothetical protein
MKTYKFEITVSEGYDEFWEDLHGKTGCDTVLQIMKDALFDTFPEAIVKLVEFSDRGQ